MDVRCTNCGEPWDLDELHELVAEGSAVDFDDARAMFYRHGCKAFGSRCSDNLGHPAIASVYDLMGDDIDGAASMLEDAADMGLI